jgi:NADH-quinone oxidoreductase subunit N
MGEGPMRDGVAALLFYIAVYGLMNLGAFALLSGFSVRGEPAETLDDLSGLSRRHPWSALGLAICVFSLMGFPPTAGFLGKVYVFSSAFSLAGDHPFHMALIWLAVIGVVNSAIGAAYYLKITAVCYFGAEGAERRPVGGPPVRVALAACSLAMLFFFAYPGLLLRGAGRATANIVSNTLPEPREVVSSSSGAVPVVELHTAFGPSVDRLP